MESTFEKIVEILENVCGLTDTDSINMDTTFEDLGLDSLDVVEAALECESTFGIEIEVETPPKTMGAFIELVESLINE